MDKGPSSVVSLELTYGCRTSYGCSSLIICPVVFRSILGYDCLPWSRRLIIFSEGIGWNPCLMTIWNWMAFTVLQTKWMRALNTCSLKRSSKRMQLKGRGVAIVRTAVTRCQARNFSLVQPGPRIILSYPRNVEHGFVPVQFDTVLTTQFLEHDTDAPWAAVSRC